VIIFLTSTGLKPNRTSIQSPWKNGMAERWVESCCREMLDHVIALNERHLLRLVGDSWIISKHPMNTTSPQGVDGRIVVA